MGFRATGASRKFETDTFRETERNLQEHVLFVCLNKGYERLIAVDFLIWVRCVSLF